MKWQKLLIVALRSIAKNRMRSLLTMLGIIVGVASIIALVTLGKGSQADIEADISSLGTNLIIIHPESTRAHGIQGGAGTSDTLSINDVTKIRTSAPAVRYVSPDIRINAQVISGNTNWNTSIHGVDACHLEIQNYSIKTGMFFTNREIKTKAKVAVLGNTVVEKLFSGQDPTGARIRIRNVPFTVIGMLSAKGETGMGTDQDDTIFIPSTTALYRLSNGKTVSTIMASSVTADQMAEAKSQIARVLRETHRLQDDANDDFQLHDQTEIIGMASQITGTLTMLLSAVAGVSLMVGGIGIMNIMLVSVTERTREIGIRMAVGAHTSDILLQFLIESVVLSLYGGIIGIFTGLGIAFGLGKIMGTSVVIDPLVILIGVGFSAAIGVFFGFYPARKAAALNPIDALRYE